MISNSFWIRLESFRIISGILWIQFSIYSLLNQKNSDNWISLNHSTLQNKVWIYLNNIWIIQNFLLPIFPTLNLSEFHLNHSELVFTFFQSLNLSELDIWMIQTRDMSTWVNVSCSRTQRSDAGGVRTNPSAPRSQVDGRMHARTHTHTHTYIAR